MKIMMVQGGRRDWQQNQIHKEVAFVRLLTEYVDKEESTNVVHACNYIEENIGKIFEPALAGKFLEFLETMNS